MAEIGDLPSGLPRPAKRALAGTGINSLDQLARIREDEVRRLHGVGPKAMRQIQDVLAARGKQSAGR